MFFVLFLSRKYRNYLPNALFGRTDRPRIFHECTNSAIIRLFVVNSWTVFSANDQHDL